MSAAAWGLTIGFAVFAGLIGFAMEIVNAGRNRNGHPFTTAAISAVIVFFLNWLIIYAGLPYFTWWSIDGWAILFFLSTIVSVIVSALVGISDDSYTGAVSGFVIWIALLIVLGIVSATTTPTWCDDSGLKKMAGMLNLQEATTAYPDTDLNDIIRVPESVALSKAGSVLSNGQNGSLGSYLSVNRAYIQKILGKPYYVVDLKVTNWLAFYQEGGTIPGYILVDAVDPSAQAEAHFGYDIQYAPGAKWGRDLDRRVYFDFLLGTPNRIQDLDGMEIDDSYDPHYVGTLEQHQIGFQGMGITGLYDYNPQTGHGTQLTLDQKPTWLERVFPVDWFAHYAEVWGMWHAHKPCQWGSTLGEEMVDRVNVVNTHGGLEYQITMTSVGNDPALTHLITVDPTTDVATLYPYKGKTLETIESMAEVASKKLNPQGYNAEGCQIHRLLNRDVAYCMLTYVDQSTTSLAAQNDTVLGGYAFVDIEAATTGQIESVAVGKTFDDAYAEFQQIIARTGLQGSLANTSADVQITGVVAAAQLVDFPDAQNRSFLISVTQADGNIAYLLAPASMLNAAIATQGKSITATCYQQPDQTYLNVRHMTVEGAPNLGGGSMFWNGLLDWLKNLFQKK